MTTVGQYLAQLSRQLVTIVPEASVQAAIQLMTHEQISALPVVKNEQMVGIVSERDYVRKVAAQRIPAWSVQVQEIMTRSVIMVSASTSIAECRRLMTANRIRHLPVVDKDQLRNIISITDLLRAMEQE